MEHALEFGRTYGGLLVIGGGLVWLVRLARRGERIKIESSNSNGFGAERKRLQHVLLRNRRGRVDPLIERRTQFIGQTLVLDGGGLVAF